MKIGRLDKAARGIKSFVENPVTNLVKGVVLLVIGISEASQTFRDDIAHGHLRVGHGMIIIGLFAILDALPHFIGSLEAWAGYLEARERKAKANEERRP